jgi:hypothetical protein
VGWLGGARLATCCVATVGLASGDGGVHWWSEAGKEEKDAEDEK